MKQEKHYLVLDSSECRLAIAGMNSFHSHLIRTEKPTEDADAMLFTLIKGKPKRRD